VFNLTQPSPRACQEIAKISFVNVTLFNIFLLVYYIQNLIVRLHILIVLNMHVEFHINRMLFTI